MYHISNIKIPIKKKLDINIIKLMPQNPISGTLKSTDI